MGAKVTAVFVLLCIALLNSVSVLGRVENQCVAAGKLAMTFDEGPSANTGDLLKTLAQNKVKVTFHFVVKYLGDPTLMGYVRMAANQGHDIGIRLDPSFVDNLPQDPVVKSLNNNANFLEKHIGFRPKFVRLPYGKASGSLVKAIEQAGFIVTEQNVDSGDYSSGATVDDIVGTFSMLLGNSPDGVTSFISVQRDQIANSVAAVPQIIQIAHENGYKVVPLSGCLGVSGGGGGGKGDHSIGNDSLGKKKNKLHRGKKGNLTSKSGKKKGKKHIEGMDHSGAEPMFLGKLFGLALLAVGSLVVFL